MNNLTNHHIGRSFSGHALEDECICPKEPCGLISSAKVDTKCEQHGWQFAKTLRQSHPEDSCPNLL